MAPQSGPILETDRLLLYPFSTEDAELFQSINTDPFVRKYLWDDVIIDLDTVNEILVTNQKHFETDKFGLWKIQLKVTDEIAGYSGLWYFFDEPQPQLIYALLEPFTGKGFAIEAGSAIIDYAFEMLGYDYLTAATDEGHGASAKVASNLGMRFIEKRTEDGKPTLFYQIKKQ